MRFANISWFNSNIKNSNMQLVNMGDKLQFLSIDYIYSQMNILADEVVKIESKQVQTYNGEEYLLLPINFSLFSRIFMCEDKISISPKIIPVYIGAYIGYYEERYFNDYNLSYLKRYSPIGCRDEQTVQILRRWGIEAYLSGCVTHLLPFSGVKGDTVFFIDVPYGVKNYIPANILCNGKFLSNQFYYPADAPQEETEKIIKMHYRKLRDEARLVVTSRLHVASPCMAMGIPVILVKENVDSRFSWLDKYIPLYDKSQWDQINWEPNPVEYEEHKRKMIKAIANRLLKQYQNYEPILEVSEFLESRKKKNQYDASCLVLYKSFDRLFAELDYIISERDNFKYGIWGLASGAEDLYKDICEKYPTAHLSYVIDSYRTGAFHNAVIYKPDYLKKDQETFIIVLAVGAANEAQKLFNQTGRKEHSYFVIPNLFLQKDMI